MEHLKKHYCNFFYSTIIRYSPAVIVSTISSPNDFPQAPTCIQIAFGGAFFFGICDVSDVDHATGDDVIHSEATQCLFEAVSVGLAAIFIHPLSENSKRLVDWIVIIRLNAKNVCSGDSQTLGHLFPVVPDQLRYVRQSQLGLQ